MKRMILLILLLVTGLAGVCAATADKAEVISFTGKAEYETPQGWVPIAVGTVLNQGTVISTGFKSSVVLAIGESRFTVAALSRISIDKLTENDSNYDTEMSLTTGKLKMNVKSKPGKSTAFTVRSPTATASVRGTSGIISATGQLQSLTGVWAMAPIGSGKSIEVKGTQSARITAPTAVETPQQTSVANATVSVTATTSLAAQEAVGPAGASSAVAVVQQEVPAAITPAPTTGSIVVNVQLPQ